MSSFVLRPSLASCSLDVDCDAEFCYRLSFGECVIGESIIRSNPLPLIWSLLPPQNEQSGTDALN